MKKGTRTGINKKGRHSRGDKLFLKCRQKNMPALKKDSYSRLSQGGDIWAFDISCLVFDAVAVMLVFDDYDWGGAFEV